MVAPAPRFARADQASAGDAVVEPLGDGAWRGRFHAMASPCEVLLEGADAGVAHAVVGVVRDEALRIERKFSRYRDDSVTARIHASHGASVEVDDETALLLDFAAQCHALSGGLFDITSGVLRQAWRFDGGRAALPEPAHVAALAARVGWPRVTWRRPVIELPEGMEIDFGGIGKEYAVDRALALALGVVHERGHASKHERGHASNPAPARATAASGGVALLVNFGGDLAVSGPRVDGRRWSVGIERPEACGDATALLELDAGALATSGDARRHVLVDGVRYGHILDPRTGWPVRGAPRSVTVAAPTCVEAGLLSTLAMLQGPDAEAWLDAQGAPHWVLRDTAVNTVPSPTNPSPTSLR